MWPLGKHLAGSYLTLYFSDFFFFFKAGQVGILSEKERKSKESWNGVIFHDFLKTQKMYLLPERVHRRFLGTFSAGRLFPCHVVWQLRELRLKKWTQTLSREAC